MAFRKLYGPTSRNLPHQQARKRELTMLRSIAAVRINKQAVDIINGERRIRWDILLDQARMYAREAGVCRSEARRLGWHIPGVWREEEQREERAA